MGLFSSSERKTDATELAMAAAGTVLQKFNKLNETIDAEVRGALAAAIQGYQDAAKTLDNAEVQQALGEAQPETVKAASKRLQAARSELDRVSARLRGLRGGVAELGGDLADSYERIDNTLPAYYARIRADFAREWAEGAAAYAALLGKRKALEAAIGEPMRELKEPQPEGRPDMGHVAALGERLTELKAAMGLLRGWRDFESNIGHDGKPLPVLPAEPPIYTTQTELCGMPAGTVVTEVSFAPGQLRRYAAVGLVAPGARAATSQGLWDAELRLQSIEQQNRQRMQDEALRRERERPDFEYKVAEPYPDLSPEERRARMDPNNPMYQPKYPRKVDYVVSFPGTPEDKHEAAPEPPMAPANMD